MEISEGDYVIIRYAWRDIDAETDSGWVFNTNYGIGSAPMALVTREGLIKAFAMADVVDNLSRKSYGPCPFYPAPCDHANGHRNPNAK